MLHVKMAPFSYSLMHNIHPASDRVNTFALQQLTRLEFALSLQQEMIILMMATTLLPPLPPPPLSLVHS